MAKIQTSWDDAEPWYSECVSEKGHYYHQKIVIPNTLKLLKLKQGDSLLDLGCGQGVLSRHLPAGIEYCGIDSAKKLIREAKSRGDCAFLTADATEKLPLSKIDFTHACFILSLQNMERQELAIRNGARHLKKGGKLLLVLNHPCFRIPRQTHWGVDEAAKLQYRRLNAYMTPQSIPIQTHPGKGEKSQMTFSFHFPLSSYASWLRESDCAILAIEEWCSDKKSTGANAKMEDRARREFPLFLALLAEKF